MLNSEFIFIKILKRGVIYEYRSKSGTSIQKSLTQEELADRAELSKVLFPSWKGILHLPP